MIESILLEETNDKQSIVIKANEFLQKELSKFITHRKPNNIDVEKEYASLLNEVKNIEFFGDSNRTAFIKRIVPMLYKIEKLSVQQEHEKEIKGNSSIANFAKANNITTDQQVISLLLII